MPRGVESSAELTGASYFFRVEEYLSLSLEVFNERLIVLLSELRLHEIAGYFVLDEGMYQQFSVFQNKDFCSYWRRYSSHDKLKRVGHCLACPLS